MTGMNLPPPIARRVQEIEPFLAVEVFERAQELERQGIDVIHRSEERRVGKECRL